MDVRARHPGQNIQQIEQQTFGSDKEEAETEATIRGFSCKLRLIPTRDQLEQVNKDKLAKELESDLYKDDCPIDMTLLKNVLGYYIDHNKFEEICQEIIDPPYEKFGDPNWYLHHPEHAKVKETDAKESPLIQNEDL